MSDCEAFLFDANSYKATDVDNLVLPLTQQFTLRTSCLPFAVLFEHVQKHVVLARDMQDCIGDPYSDVRPLYETSFGLLLASRIGELSMLSFTVQSTHSPGFTSISSLAF